MEDRAAELELPGLLRERLSDWARLRYPSEACGLLLGRREGARTVVVDICEARNRDPRRDRFDLDPADHRSAEERAQRRGLEVIGVWHSHPDLPARPSAADRAVAWDRWSYVIVAVEGGRAGELRCWRLADGRFVEQEVRS